MMLSVTAAAAFAYLVPGLDVCPPVQEDLDGPEVAYLSRPVEGSISTLSEINKIKKTCKISTLIIFFIHSIYTNIQTGKVTFYFSWIYCSN